MPVSPGIRVALDRMAADRPPGYLQRPLPDDLDRVVADFLDQYRQADEAGRAQARGALSLKHARTLGAYAERLATLAVREGSAELLSRGLLAALVAGSCSQQDLRDVLVTIAPLQRSAERLGVEPVEAFEQAALVAGPDTPDVLREFPRRAPADRSLAAFSFVERDAPDGLLYEYVTHPELLRLPSGLRDAISALASDKMEGYLRRPLPDELDDRVVELVDRFAAATDAQRRDVRRALRLGHAHRFEVFGERMATIVLRGGSREDLLRGLTATLLAALQPGEDRRAVMGVLAVLADAAERAGKDFEQAFAEAQQVVGAKLPAEVAGFPSRSGGERTLAGFGYEPRDAGAGLAYERMW